MNNCRAVILFLSVVQGYDTVKIKYIKNKINIFKIIIDIIKAQVYD